MTANDWTAICDKPHDIRLIVADMDGTLLDGDSNIPDGFWPLLDELHGAPAVHISHLKPGVGERIMEQLRAAGSALTVRRLDQGDVLEF